MPFLLLNESSTPNIHWTGAMVQWSWEKTHDQEVACLNFFASGVFSIGIQTAGQIVMKFGTEVVLTGEGTWGGG